MSMTREMAIQILGCYGSNYCWENGESIPAEAVMEAVGVALGALRAQEPRVISGDAIVAHLGGPLWLETKNNRLYTGWTLAYDIQRGMGITGTRLGLAQPGGHVMWLKLDDYGRTWRCWTACPNEERREATAWPYK